jgi:pimeloyl-ACP methyl ester carboxylesterase
MQSKEPKLLIVLVHGAWADGTGWQHVIPDLLDAGYDVTAVQLPLISLENDVETLQRVIDAQNGPVVLVAHSYGGNVVTNAANDRPNVKALVYLTSFAPDAGESMGSLLAKYPPTPLTNAVAPDSAGFLYIAKEKYPEVFAQDVEKTEARVMAVTQKPFFGGIFNTTTKKPAWKSIPTWYLITTEDRCIPPDLQRFMAKRMKAKSTEISASHSVFVSQPKVSVKVILDAAKTVV